MISQFVVLTVAICGHLIRGEASAGEQKPFTKIGGGSALDVDGPAPHKLIVRLQAGASKVSALSKKQEIESMDGVRDAKVLEHVNMMIINCESPDVQDFLISRFSADPLAEMVVPDTPVTIDQSSTPQLMPNDPYFRTLWGMHHNSNNDIDGPEAWAQFKGSEANSVIVAVIDTGIDYNHEDLNSRMWVNPGEIPGNGIDDDNNGYVDDIHGWDFVNNDADPMDDNRHGTHCAGTIAAAGNNSVGVTGVAWEGVKLMALKCFSASGGGSSSCAIAAVDYSIMMGAKISSNSWGGGSSNSALRSAIERAEAAGQLYVAAAGNSRSDNDRSPHYPSSYTTPNVLSVASSASSGGLSSFSCYGATSVDLAAPGSSIRSTVLNNGYSSLSGTSMATPHVSGVAALLWMYRPSMTMAEVKSILMNTTIPVASFAGKMVTGGRLNAKNALAAAGSFQGFYPPRNLPVSLTFVDTDMAINQISGRATIVKTSDDGDVTYYKVYFVSGARNLGLAGNVSNDMWQGQSQIVVRISQKPVPTGATGLVAVAGNATGETTPVHQDGAPYVNLTDVGLPTFNANNVSWSGDSDPTAGILNGDVIIRRAVDESTITHYNAYWKSENGTRGSLVGTLASAGSFAPRCSGSSCTRVIRTHDGLGLWNFERGRYLPRESATFTIPGPATFNITRFDTEGGYDYLRIGTKTISGRRRHLSLPMTVQVASRSVTVVWSSDYSVQRTGWSFTYAYEAFNGSIPLRSVQTESEEIEVVSAYNDNENPSGVSVVITDRIPSPPLHPPSALQFRDADLTAGEIGGVVYVAPPRSDVVDYTFFEVSLTDAAGNQLGEAWRANYTSSSAHVKWLTTTPTALVVWHSSFSETTGDAGKVVALVREIADVEYLTEPSIPAVWQPASAQIILVPELERGVLAAGSNSGLCAEMSDAGKSNLIQSIRSGLRLVSLGNVNCLNSLFSWSLTSSANEQGPGLKAGSSAGTLFAEGPTEVEWTDSDLLVSKSALPAGAKVVYSKGQKVSVFVVPYGSGEIVFLGNNWQYSSNSAWNQVLRLSAGIATSVQSVPPNWGAINIPLNTQVPTRAQLVARSGNRLGLSAGTIVRSVVDVRVRSPRAVHFQADLDASEGFISGDLSVLGAEVETSITEYVAYWSNGTSKGNLVGRLSVSSGTQKTSNSPHCTGSACADISIASIGDLRWGISRGRSGYGAHEDASITVVGPGLLRFAFVDTEADTDFLTFRGVRYSGSSSPGDIPVPAGSHELKWTSDWIVTGQGWTVEFVRPPLVLHLPFGTPKLGDGILVVSNYNGWEAPTGTFAAVDDWIVASVTCTATTMSCPLPSSVSNYTYLIQGSESNPACQVQETGSSRFFTFTKDTCGANRTFDNARGIVIDEVRLVPQMTTTTTASAPLLEFLDVVAAPLPPNVICRCESPIVGSAQTVARPGEQQQTATQQPDVIINGTSAFQPRMQMFKDPMFTVRVASGVSYPSRATRFYVEVGAQVTSTEVIGLVDCLVSPTEEPSPGYSQHFLENSCPAGPFGTQMHAEALPGISRISLRRFRYTGQNHLYFICSVRRCPSEPCAVCDDSPPSRRLSKAKDTTTAKAVFRLQLPALYDEELPTEVFDSGKQPANPEDEFIEEPEVNETVLWSSEQILPNQGAPEESSVAKDKRDLVTVSIIQCSVTIGDLSIHEISEEFRASLEKTLTKTLPMVKDGDVRVTRVFLTRHTLSSSTSRRLQVVDSSRFTEGVTLEFEVRPEGNPGNALLDRIEARLILLGSGGSSSRMFNLQFIDELFSVGISLSMDVSIRFGNPQIITQLKLKPVEALAKPPMQNITTYTLKSALTMDFETLPEGISEASLADDATFINNVAESLASGLGVGKSKVAITKIESVMNRRLQAAHLRRLAGPKLRVLYELITTSLEEATTFKNNLSDESAVPTLETAIAEKLVEKYAASGRVVQVKVAVSTGIEETIAQTTMPEASSAKTHTYGLSPEVTKPKSSTTTMLPSSTLSQGNKDIPQDQVGSSDAEQSVKEQENGESGARTVPIIAGVLGASLCIGVFCVCLKLKMRKPSSNISHPTVPSDGPSWPYSKRVTPEEPDAIEAPDEKQDGSSQDGSSTSCGRSAGDTSEASRDDLPGIRGLPSQLPPAPAPAPPPPSPPPQPVPRSS